MTKPAKKITIATVKSAAKKGKLWIKCDHYYTDDYALDAAMNFRKMEEFMQVETFVQTTEFREDGPYGPGHYNVPYEPKSPDTFVKPLDWFRGMSVWMYDGKLTLSPGQFASYTIEIRD